ncbi:urea ABC transporter membrane protein [Quadrisphaera granulorum]|uniref:Urea ABC transporter membrane protein n=1 Tax=Quadrisphaera granulorum TaxID=317664 RepID=A0A315ZPY5_9ACTN|nr:urea ABC transporter permease subunit UrtC [Quadrisphaera granulorum]PWJ47369.1 urea ABC transporter membrane protein [Quadrisphaera granulorum]SZE98816.1 urea ABC transporter membrane protein [Quadrisphaera granulorum]
MTGGLGVPSRRNALAGTGALALVLLVVAPLMLSDFRLALLGKFICFAIVAVGIGIAWGRGGMLTLGQGVFFGIGGYAMAMHLKLADAELNGGSGVPDFMLLYGDGTVPGWWEPFRSPLFTLLAVVALPALLATALGLAIFKRRIKGAYFAILSQAMVAAFVVLLVGQQQTTGGTNGLNGFRSFFGYSLSDPANRLTLYYLAAGILVAAVALSAALQRSRFGELLVATRDAEERVRFLGYDPALVKTVAFALAAALAGVAGALFVPIVGIISPADIGVVPSIVFIVGVAVGGRAGLFGPVLGAIGVAWAETSLSEAFPSFWSYFQGALLIAVIALLPGGAASLVDRLRERATSPRRGASSPPAAGAAGTPAPAAAASTPADRPAEEVHP